MSDRPVRVRIGPSPTGEPHVGTAYIALFNLAFAKRHGGAFVLRVEDTDQERSKPEWEQQIMAGLEWLGLKWDEGPDVGGPYGPYRQSERKPIYVDHAQKLLDSGHAYRCFATTEELAAKRAEVEASKGDRSSVSRLHRELPPETVQAYLDEGRPYVIRMKAPLEGQIVVNDRLRGEVTFEATQVDDQVLLKSDGYPTYHLANVVDDHLMEISHVIRAEEWISSTPKHVLLYEMFGWQPPTFVHMPLLRNKDKSKISKRKNPVSIMDYQQRGFLPEAVVNFLGTLGFTMPDERELFGYAEFQAAIDFDRVQLGGPVFDLEKLTWMNGKYLREQLEEDALVTHFQERLFSRERLAKIAPLFKERVDVAEQLIEQASYFFVGEVPLDPALLKPKKVEYAELKEAFEAYVNEIDRQVDFSPEALEALSRAFCASAGIKPKDFFMSLRVAMTGRNASPPLFDVMSVLDRALVRRRLRAALPVLKRAAADAKKHAAAAETSSTKAPSGDGGTSKKKEKKPAGQPIESIHGVEASDSSALAREALRTTDDLLARAGARSARERLAQTTNIDADRLLAWVETADLMRIKGLVGEYAALLRAAGVASLEQLAGCEPEPLAARLEQAQAEHALAKKPPHPRGVAMWIERAKALSSRVER